MLITSQTTHYLRKGIKMIIEATVEDNKAYAEWCGQLNFLPKNVTPTYFDAFIAGRRSLQKNEQAISTPIEKLTIAIDELIETIRSSK